MSTWVIITAVLALAILTAAGLVSRRVRLDLREERRRGLKGGTAAPMSADAKPKPNCVAAIVQPLLFGLGPGLVFLFAYLWAPVANEEKIYFATACFMAAAFALTLVQAVPKRSLWPLPWQAALIVIMGALTLWLRDETFIKMRPTVRFGIGLALSAWAITNAHPKMKEFYEKLDETGRRRMTFLLFVSGIACAAANELVWRNSSTLFWIGYQMWGPILIYILIIAACYPLLNSHYIGTCKVRTAE
jgi:intracellular septation protein